MSVLFVENSVCERCNYLLLKHILKGLLNVFLIYSYHNHTRSSWAISKKIRISHSQSSSKDPYLCSYNYRIIELYIICFLSILISIQPHCIFEEHLLYLN